MGKDIAGKIGDESSKLVSIIMPAYNAEKYIAESIESVLKQTYKNWELIVVDDGSKDSTRQIVEYYQAKDSRVIYAYQTNSGVASARNCALALAKGEYLSNLDSDDLWPLDKLEIQVALLNKNDQKIVLGNVERFSFGVNGMERGLITRLEPASENSVDYVRQTLNLPSNKMVHFNTFCGKTYYFRNAGGWDERFRNAEDWEFWLRLSAQVEFLHIENILQLYRKHPSSATSIASNYAVSLNSQLSAIDKCIKFMGADWRLGRAVKVRPFMQVINDQIYVKNYGAALYVYSKAIFSSNILITYAGVRLLLLAIKGIVFGETDRVK
jgi:teichuronic acid biosynthesis glycosyltransferase TuaG